MDDELRQAAEHAVRELVRVAEILSDEDYGHSAERALMAANRLLAALKGADQ